MTDGGDEMVVVSGGSITNDGTQATNIADADTSHALTDSFDDEESEAALDALATKLNAVIAALEGVGILASS